MFVPMPPLTEVHFERPIEYYNSAGLRRSKPA